MAAWGIISQSLLPDRLSSPWDSRSLIRVSAGVAPPIRAIRLYDAWQRSNDMHLNDHSPRNPDQKSAQRPADEPWLEVLGSRNVTSWLAEQHVSLACSTYQTAKLFLFGRRGDGELSVFERTFNRCMGLWSDGQTIWMSSEFQLWRFENALTAGGSHEGYDRLYIPRIGYTTGDLDTHDVVAEPTGRIVFANTKFSCLATTTPHASFSPLWRPNFVSKLAPKTAAT